MKLLLLSFTLLFCSVNKQTVKPQENETKPLIQVEKVKQSKTFPAWIKTRIEKEGVSKRPHYSAITEWEYKGKTVYFFTPTGADRYTELYDEEGNLLGHPDGGFTGKGDGKVPDFHATAKKRAVIWKHN